MKKKLCDAPNKKGCECRKVAKRVVDGIGFCKEHAEFYKEDIKSMEAEVAQHV